MDYASPQTREAGNRLIASLIEETKQPGTKRSLKSRMKRMDQGERDLYV
jgi:2-iminoacetate synthase